MSFEPSAPGRLPMKVMKGSTQTSVNVATQDLRSERRSRRPAADLNGREGSKGPSTCQASNLHPQQ
jgi:hypothetical protein